MHKAATWKDGLDPLKLMSNLGQVLERRVVPTSYNEQYAAHPGRSMIPSVGEVDSFSTYALSTDFGSGSQIGFGFQEEEFAFVSFASPLKASFFQSLGDMKGRYFRDIFQVVHLCYGDSLNQELMPYEDDPSVLVFRDDKTVCITIDENTSTLLSSRANIVVAIYDKQFWDPSPEHVRAVIQTAP
jgi:hypothetical protein